MEPEPNIAQPEIISPEPTVVMKPTVATWVQEYIEHSRPRYSVSTQRIMETELRRFAVFSGYREIDGRLIHEYCNSLLNSTLAQRTLLGAAIWLRAFLRYCEEVGYLNKRFSTLIPTIRVTPKPPAIFTPDQYELLKREAKGTPWYYASIMAYRTGSRVSDAVLMRWENVNMEHCYVRYLPYKTRQTGFYATCPFQSGSDLHEVLLEMSQARKSTDESDYLCPALAARFRVGSTICNYNRDFIPMLRKIGCRHLSFHKLRNSFISRLVNGAVPFAQASQITGLKSNGVFLQYAKPDLRVLREAIDRAESVTAQIWEQKQLEMGNPNAPVAPEDKDKEKK